MGDLIHFAINYQNYPITYKTLDNQEYLIVPAIILREGVHNDIYYTPGELNKIVQAWNNKPITINHPENYQGVRISANSPEIVEQSIGRTFHTFFDDSQNAIKTEIWINIEKARKANLELLQAIQKRKPIEVSTGLYADFEPKEGIWNEENYIGIYRNYIPDHIAILTESPGACSYDDGCGIRLNKDGKANKDKFVDVTMSQKCDKRLSIETKFKNWFQTLSNSVSRMIGLDASHEDIRSKLQILLDKLDTRQWSHYIDNVYDDYFIYRAILFAPNPSEDMEAIREEEIYYKQKYKVDNDGNVEFLDEPVKVKKETNYIPITNQRKEAGNMADTIEQKVDNEKKETPVTLEAYIKNAPPEIRESLTTLVQRDKEHKDKLVKILVENEKNKFSEDELKGFDLSTLEKIVSLQSDEKTEQELDYSGQAGTVVTNKEETVPEAPNVFDLN